MKDLENIANADKITETLNHINVKRIRKLAKCDDDFKAVIELVNKKQRTHKKCK